MRTAYLTDPRFAQHTMPSHPENAERLVAIQAQLKNDGLLDKLTLLETAPATRDNLLAVHDQAHLDRLAQAAGRTVMFGPDTYAAPQSYDIAQLAAGGVLRVVDAVMQGAADNGLAAIRPPGHHATPGMAMGFCLLNNVAIAARYAQHVYEIERVAIVDYDVHHGNGTQDIFYADPSVLYISTHQSPLYPGTGAITDTGSGPGAGATINIPLPPGVGDAGYREAFTTIVLPAVRRFAPDLVLISVGFDAHWDDPLAQMQLSLHGYDRLARDLLATAEDVCGGRAVIVLEGGYNLQVLRIGWANAVRALLGEDEAVDPLGPGRANEPSIMAIVERLEQLHKLS